jgi:hypothetical protein
MSADLTSRLEALRVAYPILLPEEGEPDWQHGWNQCLDKVLTVLRECPPSAIRDTIVPSKITSYHSYVPPEDGSAGDYYVEGWNDCIDAVTLNLTPPHPVAAAPAEAVQEPQHVCGLQGFGAPGDSCPACERLGAYKGHVSAPPEVGTNSPTPRCDDFFGADDYRGAREFARQLERENASLNKDAGRYRWLRDKSVPPHQFYISVPIEFKDEKFTPQDVDAAIDAARGV